MQCGKLKTYMETGRVVFLPVRSIRPNPGQPRRIFEESGLEELADSIRIHGILQPLSVRRVGISYELIARRTAAAGSTAGGAGGGAVPADEHGRHPVRGRGAGGKSPAAGFGFY